MTMDKRWVYVKGELTSPFAEVTDRQFAPLQKVKQKNMLTVEMNAGRLLGLAKI